MTETHDSGPVLILSGALSTALASRSREAFTSLLTEDVHWGGEHGGNECASREEAGDHYAGLLAAGATLQVIDIQGDDAVATAKLRIDNSGPEELPAEMTVRLTSREGLIADIRELDPPPTIELLYFDDCPNHEAFLPHLQELLGEHGIDAPVDLVRIQDDADARTHRFLGSPTLRVNGLDVEAAALDRDSFALQCRRYVTPSGVTGMPADDWIVDALIGNPNWQKATSAIREGNLPLLRLVLTKHPDLATGRSVHDGGRTLLQLATDWPGHFPNVRATIGALIDFGADPNSPSIGEHAETALHWAASSGDLEVLDALLDGGADIEVRGAVIGGGTALADATAFGQWAAARRLVERGARCNLFEAAALGMSGAVQALLAEESPTPDDLTSSFWGACHGGQLATAAILLDSGADLNWVGYDGLTPLDAARRAGASALATWLEGQGADTNQAR